MSLLTVTLPILMATTPVEADLPPTLRPDYVQMADSADYYIARSMWADAKRCTREALRIDPSNFNNALLLSNLGIINTNLGLDDEAIENFSLGLNIAPASTTLRTNRARVLLAKGQYERASEDLRQLLESDPANQWARKMYGVTFLARNEVAKALEQFRLIDEPDADTFRMMANIAIGRGDSDEALRLYDRMVETSPSDESYADRALLFLTLGMTGEAADDIKKGLAINDKNPTLYLLRAYLRYQMHENTTADEDKKMALRYGVDPQLVETLFPNKKKRK